jgi:two-component system chemotaxis sensor kinase CheA
VGLVVDGLIGEREVVIKPLEDDYHAFDGFSGATILGDGAVSLILDVSALLKRMKGPHHRSVEASQPAYVH